MRTVEIRRHCFTKKGDARGNGSHLSRAGVAQARRIGDTLGAFDLVLTSHIPRTLETAIAMGYAVDDQIEVMGDIPADVWDEIGHQERWEWDEPFARFAEFVGRGGATARMGTNQRETWANALDSVPDGGRVLIVSHGRVIECGLVAAVPGGDFANWGAPFQHGEGVQMCYTNGRFTDLQFRRETAAQ